jgi:hypothetical protein
MLNTFGVDLGDVLGVGCTGAEMTATGRHLQARDGSVVARNTSYRSDGRLNVDPLLASGDRFWTRAF